MASVEQLDALSADAHMLEPDQNLRDEFACPITYELIHDPVIAADGHTYDRSAIQRWLAKHDTAPKVRVQQHWNQTMPAPRTPRSPARYRRRCRCRCRRRGNRSSTKRWWKIII